MNWTKESKRILCNGNNCNTVSYWAINKKKEMENIGNVIIPHKHHKTYIGIVSAAKEKSKLNYKM